MIRALSNATKSMTVIEAVLVTALAIAVPLSWLYLRERTKGLAREASETVLADYRHVHARDLESLRAEYQKATDEFSLYARERHRAYTRVYRRFRIAADAMSGMRGFMRLPDFERYTIEDVQAYLQDKQIPKWVSGPIVDAAHRSDRKEVEKRLREVDRKSRLASANDLFRRAKNVEVMDELYLSDEVRAHLDTARRSIGALAASLEDTVDVLRQSKQDAMDVAMNSLYRLMREELRRGLGSPKENAPLPASSARTGSESTHA